MTEYTKDGFICCYHEKKGAQSAIIALIGGNPDKGVAKAAKKWLMKKFGVNVLTSAPEGGFHSVPIEGIRSQIDYLRKQGNRRIGIIGVSTTTAIALTAASLYPDISLTIALTPCDFIPEGFIRGRKDGYTEWPSDGESLLTKDGENLPYLEYAFRHPDYGNAVREQIKRTGDAIASYDIFAQSEKRTPLTEDKFIKVENIRGKILLIGAEDDSMWDTASYIARMKKRAGENAECRVYEYGTHFVYPEGMLKTFLPVGGDLITRLFVSGKKHPKECKETRKDIDRIMTRVITEWTEN